MKKKEVLKKVWFAFSLFWIGGLTVKFILGKANILDTVWLALLYAALVVYAITVIIDNVLYYWSHRTIIVGLRYLKRIHKERYMLYLTGDREEAEKYSKEIKEFGEDIIKLAECFKNLENRKRSRKMQEIIDQTQKLMTTVC